MIRTLFLTWMMILGLAQAAGAQQNVYVQIEAQPTLVEAQARVRDFSGRLADVTGYSTRTGWYAIALGPYDRARADQVLSSLRASGQIPPDSYIAFGTQYSQRFWPVGSVAEVTTSAPATTETATTETATTGTTSAEPATVETATPAAEPQVAVIQPAPVQTDETLAEARDSEAALSEDARKELQRLLQWAGVYEGAIDGAFGRGTRGSMATWQAQNGYEATGVLTTLQRDDLMRQYNSVFEGLDMRRVTDSQAGIAIDLPMGVLAFARYEPPFAKYEASGPLAARVLLISQPGDQATLYGLYDILQTLEIVPLNGPRERGERDFTLVGRNDSFVSHSEARLEDGQIKGFTLVWPTGDEARRARLLERMQSSFARLPGVLDPAAGEVGEQAVDLVSGLEVRQPRMSRSGFYVDGQGTVVTTAEVVQGCQRITLEQDFEAVVVAVDAATGVAILRPATALAPASVAGLRTSTPRLQSEIAVAGYSYGPILSAPTLTFGRLADLKGLAGEQDLKRLTLASLPGDAGGPVFDAGGGVLGMLLPRETGGTRQLPDEVSFAAEAQAIRAALTSAGIATPETDAPGQISPEELTRLARKVTVLVSCWD